VLPATHFSVLLLLIVSLVCLGSWINTFKAVARKWRFELFALDVAVGAIAVVLFAAFTLGAMGSDLGVSDRILVAGRTAQALAIIAGAVFNLGNMLLLAAVALLGVSNAFPFIAGMALIISSCFYLRPGNLLYLVGGMVVSLCALLFEIRSARLREAYLQARTGSTSTATGANPSPAAAKMPSSGVTAPAPAAVKKRPTFKRKQRRTVRGIVAGVVGGVALGLFVPILQNCLPGDLGLGAYAGMLLFGVGVLGSTFVYDFYFLNITIEGGSLTFAAYFRGKLGQHLAGLSGGALCMGGLLAAALAIGSPAAIDVAQSTRILLPLLSVPLAFLFGITVWRELSPPAAARVANVLALLFFLGGLGLFVLGVTR
jgi:glucose uptake protein